MNLEPNAVEHVRMIGLEQHFVTDELAAYGAGTAKLAQPRVWAEASRRLLDLTGERLEVMDAAGLDMQVLSLNSPGIQAEPDAVIAVKAAAAVNDLEGSSRAHRPDVELGAGHAPTVRTST